MSYRRFLPLWPPFDGDFLFFFYYGSVLPLSQAKESQITSNGHQNKSDDYKIDIGLHNLLSVLINKIKNNQNNATYNSGQKISISNIPLDHSFTSPANFNETIKKNPASTIETTNVVIKSKIDSGRASRGEIAPAENQATAIFPTISDALSNMTKDNKNPAYSGIVALERAFGNLSEPENKFMLVLLNSSVNMSIYDE